MPHVVVKMYKGTYRAAKTIDDVSCYKCTY
jgi:hypothetical protein